MAHVPLWLAPTFSFALMLGLNIPGLAPPTADDTREYENARAKAGDSASAHVALALWCEAHGMMDERTAQLQEAVRLEPDHPLARALQGLMQYEGRWLAPEKVGETLRSSPEQKDVLAEYHTQRDRLARFTRLEQEQIEVMEAKGPKNKIRERKAQLDHRLAPEHAHLGLWCEQHGLKEEATAHFRASLNLDPSHEATWRKLGYTNHGGRWLNHDQMSAFQAAEIANRHNRTHWDARLRKLAEALAIAPAREKAEAELNTIDDPGAVASIVHLFVHGSPASQEFATRLLTQIDAPDSTQALAYLAILGATPEIRSRASWALDRREPLDFAGQLVAMIHTPCQFEYQPITGPGTRGTLVVDTPRFHLLRNYTALALPVRNFLARGGYVGYDMNGLPVMVDSFFQSQIRMDLWEREWKEVASDVRTVEAFTQKLISDYNIQNVLIRERMFADVRALVLFNESVKLVNPRVTFTLQTALGAPVSLGDDEDAWATWYYDRIGYRYLPPPKVDFFGNQMPRALPPRLLNCFVAGTPVLTPDGPRPIESLWTGDRVLGQDTATGALAFQTVQFAHDNPPDTTTELSFDNGDVIACSPYHRFWRPGDGWIMARDLKAGDPVRTLGGVVALKAQKVSASVPTYSLVVAGQSFFVGKSVALVHDETLPAPHPDHGPFDAIAARSEGE